MRSAILFRATEHLTKWARDASNAGRCEMDRHNSVPYCNPHGGHSDLAARSAVRRGSWLRFAAGIETRAPLCAREKGSRGGGGMGRIPSGRAVRCNRFCRGVQRSFRRRRVPALVIGSRATFRIAARSRSSPDVRPSHMVLGHVHPATKQSPDRAPFKSSLTAPSRTGAPPHRSSDQMPEQVTPQGVAVSPLRARPVRREAVARPIVRAPMPPYFEFTCALSAVMSASLRSVITPILLSR
jgi:hypothetical protein